MRLESGDRNSIDDIISGAVRNEQGSALPFSTLVTLSEAEGMTRIYRLNGRRAVSVTAKIGSLSFQEGETRIRRMLESMTLPAEYSYEFDARLKSFREERRGLLAAVLFSVLLIYMILASQFESLTLPVVIMITIPLAAAGIAPVLFLTFTPLSPPVYLGIIVLAGVVVNNGILLVDAINLKLRSAGEQYHDIELIVKEVSTGKFRAIVITSLTTILGMLPMLIDSGEGSSLWRPFALTVTAGLLFSTLLTLVALPAASIRFFK